MSLLSRLTLSFYVCYTAYYTVLYGPGVMTRFLAVLEALAGNPKPFALSYSAGNLVSLCSTAFIVGPMTQVLIISIMSS